MTSTIRKIGCTVVVVMAGCGSSRPNGSIPTGTLHLACDLRGNTVWRGSWENLWWTPIDGSGHTDDPGSSISVTHPITETVRYVVTDLSLIQVRQLANERILVVGKCYRESWADCPYGSWCAEVWDVRKREAVVESMPDEVDAIKIRDRGLGSGRRRRDARRHDPGRDAQQEGPLAAVHGLGLRAHRSRGSLPGPGGSRHQLAKSQSENTLRHQVLHRVIDQPRLAMIGEARRQSLAQP